MLDDLARHANRFLQELERFEKHRQQHSAAYRRIMKRQELGEGCVEAGAAGDDEIIHQAHTSWIEFEIACNALEKAASAAGAWEPTKPIAALHRTPPKDWSTGLVSMARGAAQRLIHLDAAVALQASPMLNGEDLQEREWRELRDACAAIANPGTPSQVFRHAWDRIKRGVTVAWMPAPYTRAGDHNKALTDAEYGAMGAHTNRVQRRLQERSHAIAVIEQILNADPSKLRHNAAQAADYFRRLLREPPTLEPVPTGDAAHVSAPRLEMIHPRKAAQADQVSATSAASESKPSPDASCPDAADKDAAREQSAGGQEPDDDGIPPRARKAGEQYKQTAEALGVSNPTDRHAYDQLEKAHKQAGEHHELPDFATWCRYLREYRKLTNQQKHRTRSGRTSRIVRRASEV